MDNTSEQKTENQEKKKIVRGPRLNQKLKKNHVSDEDSARRYRRRS